MTFNYKTATDQELIEHIENSSCASVSVAKAYHKKQGNNDVVARIDCARGFLKVKRMQDKTHFIISENQKHGFDIKPDGDSLD